MSTRLRVALVCTAPQESPGSMLAYSHTLEQALKRYVPEIDVRVVRIGPASSGGTWAHRADTLMMQARAWEIRGVAPDIWHILDGSRAYIASVLGNAPIVITAHDLIPWLQWKGHFPASPRIGTAARWLWRWNARQFKSAAKVVCVSNSTARDAARCFSVSPERSVVVPLTLRPSLAEFLARPGSTTREEGMVLHVGNNGFYKARDAVLRIFARMDPAKAMKLVMIGPMPTPELSALACKLGIAERSEWISDPNDEILAAHYQRASVMLFPSRYEGFGWPVLESMAFGLPVICSDRGSLPEVAGDACPCIDPDDYAAFASAALKIIADPACARLATRRGLERSTGFSEERLASAMRDTYREVLQLGKTE